MTANSATEGTGSASPGTDNRPRGAVWVGISSAVASVAGVVIMFVASHALSPADNAEFLSFWAALFLVSGLLGGVQTEATRAISEVSHRAVQRSGALVLSAALTIGGAAAAVLLLLSPILTTVVFKKDAWTSIVCLTVTALLFPVHAALSGSLQGQRQWDRFGQLVSLESTLRLIGVAAAALMGASLGGVEVACLTALLAWMSFVLASRRARASLRVRTSLGLRALLGNMGHALLSAASSAALVVGFPILLKLTTSAQDYALTAPLLLAVSLTRAPIMIPLQSFQGVAIAHVVRNPDEGWRALLKPLVWVAGIGLAGTVLAWFIGPPLMLIFGPAYVISPWVVSSLTFAAALMAILTLLGTAVISLGHHAAFSTGWIVATAVCVGVLLLPLGTDLRTVLSLTLGPLCGIAIHALSLGARRRGIVRAS
ncbi:lipopolysaccharide biosynthesis protein [Sinomonas sp. P47F7]|uniref:lipopolysaccharide biosynthesis protein n=1 Tax=Sinomonas sp. P47F7 TaxID=3410987 RepID=UPI003BF61986